MGYSIAPNNAEREKLKKECDGLQIAINAFDAEAKKTMGQIDRWGQYRDRLTKSFGNDNYNAEIGGLFKKYSLTGLFSPMGLGHVMPGGMVDFADSLRNSVSSASDGNGLTSTLYIGVAAYQLKGLIRPDAGTRFFGKFATPLLIGGIIIDGAEAITPIWRNESQQSAIIDGVNAETSQLWQHYEVDPENWTGRIDNPTIENDPHVQKTRPSRWGQAARCYKRIAFPIRPRRLRSWPASSGSSMKARSTM